MKNGWKPISGTCMILKPL